LDISRFWSGYPEGHFPIIMNLRGLNPTLTGKAAGSEEGKCGKYVFHSSDISMTDQMLHWENRRLVATLKGQETKLGDVCASKRQDANLLQNPVDPEKRPRYSSTIPL
jgi:hypothetical protein